MSSRAIRNYPPMLYNVLKAEGWELPDECRDITLMMPVDGALCLRLELFMTPERLRMLGRALVKMGEPFDLNPFLSAVKREPFDEHIGSIGDVKTSLNGVFDDTLNELSDYQALTDSKGEHMSESSSDPRKQGSTPDPQTPYRAPGGAGNAPVKSPSGPPPTSAPSPSPSGPSAPSTPTQK